jgi:hypothetical protein
MPSLSDVSAVTALAAQASGSPVEEWPEGRPFTEQAFVERAKQFKAQPLVIREAVAPHWPVVDLGQVERLVGAAHAEVWHVPAAGGDGAGAGAGARLVAGEAVRALADQGEHEQELRYMYRPVAPERVREWVPACLGRVQVRQANVWAGVNRTSRIHLDGCDNLLVCAVGQKIVHLYSAWETTRLYPRAPDRLPVESRVGSFVDYETVSDEFPQFREAERQVAVLRPGQALFLPAG